MPRLDFQGTGKPLSIAGLRAVTGQLGVQTAEIWAVLAVETSGCGYLPDRRPQIRFERHIFHRLTGGRFDDGDISDESAGGYGASGSHQYDRLARAIARDRAAALKSTSWGIAQILGENHMPAGFSTVEGMVAAMVASEDQQLAAWGSFLAATGLAAPLKAHDWAAFARGYNGRNFAINKYDVRLNAEFQKYSAGVLPDLNVRTAQLYLTYLGFQPGRIDGIAGERTLAALAEFQAHRGLPGSTNINGETLADLDGSVGLSEDDGDAAVA
jgi:N-acetylmuramidase/Putative peptidoglycan binding domain